MFYTFRRLIQPLTTVQTIVVPGVIIGFLFYYELLYVMRGYTHVLQWLCLAFYIAAFYQLLVIRRRDTNYRLAFYSYYLLLGTLLILSSVVVAVVVGTLLSQLIRPLFIPYIMLSVLLFYTVLQVASTKESHHSSR